MIDSVRNQALLLLNRLEMPRAPTLDDLMDSLFASQSGWQPRDRALATALIYGVLRWRRQLDWILTHCSHTPLKKLNPTVHNILRLGLLQLHRMDRIPASAAVNTSVELTKAHAPEYLAKFVNGVLRNTARRLASLHLPDASGASVTELAIGYSLPEWLVTRWLARLGAKSGRALCEAQNAIAPLTLRVNTLKTERHALAVRLEAQGWHVTPFALAPEALNLDNWRGPVFELDGFSEGLFQVQDTAAQLAGRLLAPRSGQRVLDACAGLGGKTGLLAQMMENQGEITAIDRVAEKLQRLGEEMQRLGVLRVTTRQADIRRPDSLGSECFDGILLDAPCSGLGALRRNPDMRWRAEKRDIRAYARRQLQMLTNLAPLVKPGGNLVYAVCSTEPEETHQIIHTFLNQHANFIPLNAQPFLPPAAGHLVDADGFFSIQPYQHNTDGFFAARLYCRESS